MTTFSTSARTYAPGMGEAVANRSINRTINGKTETWADVAHRVAVGNASLVIQDQKTEQDALEEHLRSASLLMSGRHLQHGDADQTSRNLEVFTNCSSSPTSFMLFYLLLNGSGVGRCYDDEMIVTDWADQPPIYPVLSKDHKDVLSGEIGYPIESVNLFNNMNIDGEELEVFVVPDSREGWAQTIELIELRTYEKSKVPLFLDFNNVRPRGSPIGGMQDRPASGPGPIIDAINNITTLKGRDESEWMLAMLADHYLAECVLVGGARRAARMATKRWSDAGIHDFINLKNQGGHWTANNSITVDKEFWSLVAAGDEHATEVFEAASHAAYSRGTGEPGIINEDKLQWKTDGLEKLTTENYFGSDRYQLLDETSAMIAELINCFKNSEYQATVNPCAEISFSKLGAYCTIADTVPYFAQPEEGDFVNYPDGSFEEEAFKVQWDKNARSAFRTAARALIRVNTMNSLYGFEVKRTNRIGVGFTGIHEYAWARFGYSFRDLIDEDKSQNFWKMMQLFATDVENESYRYSIKLGASLPHTIRTVKPAGTTSKLFGLTEGAHLPSMREFLRHVQFRHDDPKLEEYRAMGYPVRELETYKETVIVGFPTQPLICTLGMGDKLVTAVEATPEEQYQWLRLIEKYWIRAGAEEGHGDRGNQVSYTLKFDPKEVTFEEYKKMMLEGQSQVRCCSVMPFGDTSAYEYTPEEPITIAEYHRISEEIASDAAIQEDVGIEHVDTCTTGACPIDFK